jgi:cytochrome c oxidase cbb3-type subunit 2
MPAYPYLFTVKDAKDAEAEGEQPLALPPAYGPDVGQVVVPSPQALDLVKYLQGLNHSYPLLPPLPPLPVAAAAASSPASVPVAKP